MEIAELEKGLIVRIRGYCQPCIIVRVDRDSGRVGLLPLRPTDGPDDTVECFNISHRTMGWSDRYRFSDGHMAHVVYTTSDKLEPFTVLR